MKFALPGGKLTLQFQPSFGLMIVIYGAAAGGSDLRRSVIWGGVIGFSILWHELGHALTSLAFGSGADISLHGFGGETRPRREKVLKTWQRFLVSANGCAAGFALAAAAVAVAHFADRRQADLLLLNEFLPPILWANVVVSLMNLLPVQPLDGGHLVLLLLHSRFGRNGVRAAHVIGIAAASVTAVVFFVLGRLYLAGIAAFLAVGEYRAFRRAAEFNPQDEDEGLHREFKNAQELWKRGEKDAAVRNLIDLRKRLGKGLIHDAATRQLAYYFEAQGQHGAAYPLLKSVPRGELTIENRLLLQTLAHQAGDFEEAVRVGQDNFQTDPDPATAANIAASYAGLADARRCVQWLKTATRRGLEKGALDLRDPEFDKVRDDADFQDFEREYASKG